MAQRPTEFTPITCIVDFHHARGPEVERWFGINDTSDLPTENDWSLLPFLALSDGAHASIEEFSYFTLRHNHTPGEPPSSLFGIACTRQISAAELIHRGPDVTRSAVQKALVAVVKSPYHFARIREQLAAVTKGWFEQKDFRNIELLEVFQESLVHICKTLDDERDQYVGLSLREMVHEYKQQLLLLFKCYLLQPKMLFFGSHCEKMCLLQFTLISLIPGLLRNLQDCADPNADSYESTLAVPTSLRTSERASLLTYMGLPLQLFGKGSFFGPYTPLQQLDMLSDAGTKSYVAGSTNSLVLMQKDKYSDVLINLDENSINVTSPALKAALYLSGSDKRWIEYLVQTVNETWDADNPNRPTNHGYTGSEEFLRLQFEEYLLALLSSTKYQLYAQRNQDDPTALLAEAYGYPANDFGAEWVVAWMKTDNFRMFNKFTDSHLFDIVEPKHPCAGGMSIEDVQRRVAQQVSELHLDERINNGREVIGKHLATGQKKVSSALNTIWSDIEVMRETQRKKYDGSVDSPSGSMIIGTSKGPDLIQAQAQVQAASARAGAYLSSWGAWAAEKRKAGWNRNSSTDVSTSATPPADFSRPSITTVSVLSEAESVIAAEKSEWVEVDRNRLATTR